MSVGAVVVPIDLPHHIIGSGQHHGWFAGLKLTQENVFVASSVIIGEQEFGSELQAGLLSHRAAHPLSGHYENRLLQWWVVEPGFQERFRSGAEVRAAEFQALLPAVVDENELFLVAIEPGPDGAMVSAIAVSRRDDTIKVQSADSINLKLKPDPFERIPKDIIAAFLPRSAVIAGLGSGGAELALNLACAGVGKLTLIDDDRLRPENYFRFIVGNSDLGRNKVDAVRSAIRERELQTQVITHSLNLVSEANLFMGIVEAGTDLLVCATDSIASRRTVNAASVLLRVPCVMAATLDAGRIGEVLLLEPFRSPCYECVRLELGAALQFPDSAERSVTPYVGTEEESLGSAAFRSDVTLVASLATRVALHVLAPNEFPGFPANYIVWGREASQGHSEPFRFDVPFSTNYVPIKRRKDCPLCGVSPSELAGVDVEKRAREILNQIDR